VAVSIFILIHPTVWLQYTNVAERQTDRQTDNSPVAQGEPFYKRSPKNGSPMLSDRCLYCAVSPVCLSEMLAHCAQTVGWIKICHLVGRYASAKGTLSQMGSQLPTPQKGGGQSSPSIFGPCLLWPNGWMDQDATWYGDRPRSRRHCVSWATQFSPRKGHTPTPLFGACLLWPEGRPCQLLLSTCTSSRPKTGLSVCVN